MGVADKVDMPSQVSTEKYLSPLQGAALGIGAMLTSASSNLEDPTSWHLGPLAELKLLQVLQLWGQPTSSSQANSSLRKALT